MITRHLLSRAVRCLALIASILVAGAWLTSSSHAQSQPPKEFLQGIYKQYMGKGAEGIDMIGHDKASLYFDDTLTDLIVKDQDESEGELGRLDFDPIVNGQDYEIRNVSITVAMSPGDESHAKATASFLNFGRRQKVFYDLVKTAKGWRISNISWIGTKDTLLSIMSGPRF